MKKKSKSKKDPTLSFLCSARIVFFIRFKNSFDSGTQHTDAGIDERQNSLLTALNERRLPGRATQQVAFGDGITASLEL